MSHDSTTGPDHYVPEGWDELNRGICPRCGATVAWNDETEVWEEADMVVLVLTPEEFTTLREDALMIEELEPLLDMMADARPAGQLNG